MRPRARGPIGAPTATPSGVAAEGPRKGLAREVPAIENLTPGQTRDMDSLEIIREVEDVVDRQTRFHAFQRAWGVDEEKFFTLLNRLRASLPEDLKQASRIAKDSDRILADAHEQAGRILAEAQEQAALLVSNDEISKQAVRQAEEILTRAREEAADTRREVNDYAKRVLTSLEGYTSKLLTTIERGRQRLEQNGTVEDAAPEDKAAR